VLLEDSQALAGTFGSSLNRVFPNNIWAIASGRLGFVALIGLYYVQRRRDFQTLNSTKELNTRNQEAFAAADEWVRSQKAT
jgi:hypothetical protein